MAASTSSAPTYSANCPRRPSSISAIRYRICPRLYAVAPDHLPTAPRAATTASRTSLREACATCTTSPDGAVTGYVRPDSDRGHAPPMNHLYVLRTETRSDIEVRRQSRSSTFAAEAGFLVAAERRGRV